MKPKPSQRKRGKPKDYFVILGEKVKGQKVRAVSSGKIISQSGLDFYPKIWKKHRHVWEYVGKFGLERRCKCGYAQKAISVSYYDNGQKYESSGYRE